MADDTQTETREIANAMFKLCRPLSPAIFDTHSNMTDGIYLSRDEVCAIQNKQDELCSGGRRENVEYKDKLKTLGIYTYDQSSQSI
jgi:hypothetical protein